MISEKTSVYPGIRIIHGRIHRDPPAFWFLCSQVDQMKTGIQRGVEMMRTFGPPLPPMPTMPFGMPPPPGPPGPLAFPGAAAPFPMPPRPDAAEPNNRFGQFLFVCFSILASSRDNRHLNVTPGTKRNPEKQPMTESNLGGGCFKLHALLWPFFSVMFHS